MVTIFLAVLGIRYIGVALATPEYISEEFVSFLLFFAVYAGTRAFRGRGEQVVGRGIRLARLGNGTDTGAETAQADPRSVGSA